MFDNNGLYIGILNLQSLSKGVLWGWAVAVVIIVQEFEEGFKKFPTHYYVIQRCVI